MRSALLAASFVIVAASCGSTAALSSASPTPSPSPSPTAAALLCRLPIDRGTGALLDIPSTPIGPKVFNSTDDPASQVKLPDGEPRSALSYDWAFKRWLPVPHQWLSPDGARYVYADSQGRVHLVGVSDGSDAIIASGANWGLYGFTDTGIYAGQRDPSKQPSLLGLWRLSSTGGAAEKVTADGTWLVIGADAAWSVEQSGPASGPPVPENSIGLVVKRLDLKTGTAQTWYTSSNGRLRVAALDSSGQPVLVNVDTAQILLVTAAGAAQTIATGGLPSDLMADTHGIWFTQPMGISIYLLQGGNLPLDLGQYGYAGAMLLFAGPCQ